MKYCSHCGITILADKEICPLCHAVLKDQGESVEEIEADGYPDIAEKTERWQRAFKVGAYFSIVAIIGLAVINYLVTPKVPWAVIAGVSILYVLLSLRELPSRRTGSIRKLYFQAVAVFVVLGSIDLAIARNGWSISIGLPCILLSFEVIVLIFMLIHFSEWQSYLTIQILLMIASIIYLILSLTGVAGYKPLAWITFAVCTLFWSTTLIIGGRKAETELRGKFHL